MTSSYERQPEGIAKMETQGMFDSSPVERRLGFASGIGFRFDNHDLDGIIRETTGGKPHGVVRLCPPRVLEPSCSPPSAMSPSQFVLNDGYTQLLKWNKYRTVTTETSTWYFRLSSMNYALIEVPFWVILRLDRILIIENLLAEQFTRNVKSIRPYRQSVLSALANSYWQDKRAPPFRRGGSLLYPR